MSLKLIEQLFSIKHQRLLKYHKSLNSNAFNSQEDMFSETTIIKF